MYIIFTCEVLAAAPKAIPSASTGKRYDQINPIDKCKKYRPAACTTSPSVAVKDLLFLEFPFSGSVNSKAKMVDILFTKLLLSNFSEPSFRETSIKLLTSIT